MKDSAHLFFKHAQTDSWDRQRHRDHMLAAAVHRVAATEHKVGASAAHDYSCNGTTNCAVSTQVNTRLPTSRDCENKLRTPRAIQLNAVRRRWHLRRRQRETAAGKLQALALHDDVS